MVSHKASSSSEIPGGIRGVDVVSQVGEGGGVKGLEAYGEVVRVGKTCLIETVFSKEA